ncbi:MAG TPA: ROK family protein [Pseudonocardiaceae bacterium]|jgi:glucokinase|nr:ROK family protein [Pseudonocardiaceae bacterium]
MSSSQPLWAGIDIGASKILAVLCDDEGRERARGTAPTPSKSGGESILDATADVVSRLLKDVDGAALAGAGVGAAGVIDPDGGVVVTTGDSFTGWAGTAVNAGLSARLGGVPVRTENDVKAFLLGELSVPGVDNPPNVLGITLGTGVGGALIVDGRLLHGGSTGAGEIGHVGAYGHERCSCGEPGHLEAYAAGRALTRRYRLATGQDRTAAEVADAAAAGDEVATRLYEEAGRYLGAAIAYTGGLLGLDLAILGGSVVGSWPALEGAVLRTLASQPLLSKKPVRVRLSQLGSTAVAIGALALAKQ